MVPILSMRPVIFAEEHALFDVDERCRLELGDTVELVPGYAPSTVNLYDVFHVVEGGVVTEIWPVIPRGPGHVGILTGGISMKTLPRPVSAARIRAALPETQQLGPVGRRMTTAARSTTSRLSTSSKPRPGS